MQAKDYYKTLNVPPHASPAEIKKAYRLLAKQYHPDVVGDNLYAQALYADIKEAYETLTNPYKKNKYLQERWYQKSQGTVQAQHAPTPILILKDALAFEKSCSQADVFRMNKKALYEEINTLLSPQKMDVLKKFNDNHINEQVARSFLASLPLLQLNDARQVVSLLTPLLTYGSTTAIALQQSLRQANKQATVQRWQWLWVLLVTLLLCLLIRWASQ
jgi:molecular chaperone DnaJ